TVAWVLVTAASGGLAAGGLAVAAGCVSGPERLAIGAGLAAGIAASSPVLGLPRAESWPGFLVHLAVFVLAVVLAWRQEPPRAASGTIGVVVAVGVIVMAGLVARSAAVEELGPGSWARYSALGVAALAGLVLAWHAGSLGGLDLARWPVLGFALAVPVTTLVSGASTPTSALDFAVPMGAAIAGATLAAILDRLAPWEAFGGFAAAAGLALGESLLTLGGTAFALGAGLTRTAALPAGGAGIALGLAGMLLSAQALGPVTLEMLSFTGPAATAVAALVVVVLFALYRPTDRLSRELLTQAA
ncbi:hypothetical protein, partial [Allorhizocola rhizosphaerae]|uniref:hypothetical protein n=1 Tax=Allorhizocola rhizosphaerae TaxID=1872709 RepID=UPI0013C2A52D